LVNHQECSNCVDRLSRFIPRPPMAFEWRALTRLIISYDTRAKQTEGAIA